MFLYFESSSFKQRKSCAKSAPKLNTGFLTSLGNSPIFFPLFLCRNTSHPISLHKTTGIQKQISPHFKDILTATSSSVVAHEIYNRTEFKSWSSGLWCWVGMR